MKHTTPFIQLDYQPSLGMISPCDSDWRYHFDGSLEPESAFCESTETM
jgi:hypothetical protein